MNNIQIASVTNPLDGVITEHVIIDRGNGEYTSMPKVIWDAQQAIAEQSPLLGGN